MFGSKSFPTKMKKYANKCSGISSRLPYFCPHALDTLRQKLRPFRSPEVTLDASAVGAHHLALPRWVSPPTGWHVRVHVFRAYDLPRADWSRSARALLAPQSFQVRGCTSFKFVKFQLYQF